MDIQRYAAYLKDKIAHGLPGKEAQLKMVSATFRERYGDIQPNTDTREGAVLILLYPEEDGNIHLPLIVRPSHEKGVHSGQVAFPGGKKEFADADFAATALREAQEEIGLHIEGVQIVGQLSPLYVFASNFMVYPVLAYMTAKPKNLVANPQEVAEIFSVSISHLQNKSTLQKTVISAPQYTFETPYFAVKDKVVWGATAMMLSELVAIA